MGLRSWTDTTTTAPTTAENKPVCFSVAELMLNVKESNLWTHEDNDAIRILLPAFGHLIIFFLSNF